VVVPRRKAAFSARYPAVPAAALVGEYFSSLSNNLANGGEELVLVAANGTEIKRFRYDDEAPWPATADGIGFSLVLIAPDTNPNHNDARNWRTSLASGGNPAGTDVAGLGAWMQSHGMSDPASDGDHDGWPAILEYVFGGDPQSSDLATPVDMALDEIGPALILRRRVGTDDVILSVESSGDLMIWEAALTDQVMTTRDPAGDVEEVTFRIAPSSSHPGRGFLRWRATQ
jgi:hypothetical protein